MDSKRLDLFRQENEKDIIRGLADYEMNHVWTVLRGPVMLVAWLVLTALPLAGCMGSTGGGSSGY
jgi:hypothetical protein